MREKETETETKSEREERESVLILYLNMLDKIIRKISSLTDHGAQDQELSKYGAEGNKNSLSGYLTAKWISLSPFDFMSQLLLSLPNQGIEPVFFAS